jgi:hypothetical protein
MGILADILTTILYSVVIPAIELCTQKKFSGNGLHHYEKFETLYKLAYWSFLPTPISEAIHHLRQFYQLHLSRVEQFILLT